MSQLLTQILSQENMMTAFAKVCVNKGSAGVDGITVNDIGLYLNKNWETIKSQVLETKEIRLSRRRIRRIMKGLNLVSVDQKASFESHFKGKNEAPIPKII